MSEFAYPLGPETPAQTARSHGRRIDRLEGRSHGSWHNAGATNPDGTVEPVCNLTPDPNYMNGVGFRFRRWLGGGTNLQIAVLDGSPGDIVGTLNAAWYVSDEGRIPCEGHNNGVAQGFYIDTDNGNIVVGV